MPTIRIPTNAILEYADDQGEKKTRAMTFVDDWIIGTLTNDASFGANGAAGLAAGDIMAAFRGRKPGDLVEITHDQHERLVKVIASPNPPFRAFVLKQIPAFIKATTSPLTDEQLAALKVETKEAQPS